MPDEELLPAGALGLVLPALHVVDVLDDDEVPCVAADVVQVLYEGAMPSGPQDQGAGGVAEGAVLIVHGQGVGRLLFLFVEPDEQSNPQKGQGTGNFDEESPLQAFQKMTNQHCYQCLSHKRDTNAA